MSLSFNIKEAEGRGGGGRGRELHCHVHTYAYGLKHIPGTCIASLSPNQNVLVTLSSAQNTIIRPIMINFIVYGSFDMVVKETKFHHSFHSCLFHFNRYTVLGVKSNGFLNA